MTNSISGSPLLDTDTLLVNRGGIDYHTTYREVYPPISDCPVLPEPPDDSLPWEGHNGGIFHIKNVTGSDLTLIKGCPAWDIDGTNERQISKVRVGEELVFTTYEDASKLFYNNTACKWDFGEITDTSKVTDMSEMFREAWAFDSYIGNWDVSNVKNMQSMFERARAFNQDIGGWSTGNVLDPPLVTYFGMGSMFHNAFLFNQDLSSWCVTHITTEPSYFGYHVSWVLPKPVWGTCPAQTITKNVTVVNNKFHLDGSKQPSIALHVGDKIAFDQRDPSNSGYPLRIYVDSSIGRVEATDGVVITAELTTFTVPDSRTYYYDGKTTKDMGGQINIS